MELLIAMNISLRTSFFGKIYYSLLQRFVLPHLAKFGLTPGQLTFTGLFLAAMVPPGFLVHPAIGVVMMTASGLADSLDGLLARTQGSASRQGAFLDSTLDRLADFFFLLGFWVLCLPFPRQRLVTVLFMAAVLSTFLISYVKARGEALGVECRVGFMERGVRVVYLLAWAILAVSLRDPRFVLWSGLICYIGLTAWTVIHRVIHIHNSLACSDINKEL